MKTDVNDVNHLISIIENAAISLNADLQNALQKIEKYEKALEFYANKDNWDFSE